MASGRLADYLGKGGAADRPATLTLHPEAIGFYYAEDSGEWSAWDGVQWLEDIMAGGGGGGGVPDAPSDGTLYGRKDGGWEAIPRGGAGQGWFDVTSYGAAGDGVTDDTLAIQAAINAAEAAGGGIVYFPPGVYVVGGALQDTSRSNAQLLLPRVSAVSGEQISISLAGAFPPPPIFSVVGSTPLPETHSIIKSTLNTGSGSVIGGWGPVGSFDDYTFVALRVSNLTVRLPSNPALTACDFSRVCAIDLDSLTVDCGNYHIQGLTEPTTSTSFGIRCPANSNGACVRLGEVNVAGFYNGYEFAEHATGYGTQSAWGCKRAFVFASATHHGSHFQRLMAVHCERVVVGAGPHYVDIGQLNVEHAASGWWTTDFDVDDPGNQLVGRLTWHVVLAGVGVSGSFAVNGAAKMDIARLGLAGRVEQVLLSASITLEGRHANKHLLHPASDTSARTWTIPANSSVPYPIGTTLTFVNGSGAGPLTIAIAADTLSQAGTGSTGDRALAANGQATALKIADTEWQINGVGLT